MFCSSKTYEERGEDIVTEVGVLLLFVMFELGGIKSLVVWNIPLQHQEAMRYI